MACRTVSAPKDLVRVGVSPSEEWYVGAGVGRGAWCCPREVCVRDLTRSRLAKAMRRDVSDADVTQIRTLIGGAGMESVVRN